MKISKSMDPSNIESQNMLESELEHRSAEKHKAGEKKLFSKITTLKYLRQKQYITTRTYNCLVRLNYNFVGDIVANFTCSADLYSIRGLGEKSIEEIKFVLANTGLNLKEQSNENSYFSYFSDRYPFLNLDEIEFVIQYYKQYKIEPFLFILYRYMIRSNDKYHIMYCHYYGFYDMKPLETGKIASLVGLSRERIRQILHKGIFLENNLQIRFNSDAISNCLIIDEESDMYLHTVKAQNIPLDFFVFAGIISLFGCYSYHIINGHKCVLNYKRVFDFDCISFIQRCQQLTQHRRVAFTISIVDLLDTNTSNEAVKLGKYIASKYLGLETTEQNEIIFKQTYIDYEFEIYNILIENGKPMLLNDIIDALKVKHPNSEMPEKSSIRKKMFDRDRIMSEPIENSRSKLYKADPNKADIDLDKQYWDDDCYNDGYDDDILEEESYPSNNQ